MLRGLTAQATLFSCSESWAARVPLKIVLQQRPRPARGSRLRNESRNIDAAQLAKRKMLAQAKVQVEPRAASQPRKFKFGSTESNILEGHECPICSDSTHGPALFDCGTKMCAGRDTCRNCLVERYAAEQTSQFDEEHPRCPPKAGTLVCACCRAQKQIPKNLIQAATEAARKKVVDLGYKSQLGLWEERHDSDLSGLTNATIKSKIATYCYKISVVGLIVLVLVLRD